MSDELERLQEELRQTRQSEQKALEDLARAQRDVSASERQTQQLRGVLKALVSDPASIEVRVAAATSRVRDRAEASQSKVTTRQLSQELTSELHSYIRGEIWKAHRRLPGETQQALGTPPSGAA